MVGNTVDWVKPEIPVVAGWNGLITLIVVVIVGVVLVMFNISGWANILGAGIVVGTADDPLGGATIKADGAIIGPLIWSLLTPIWFVNGILAGLLLFCLLCDLLV